MRIRVPSKFTRDGNFRIVRPTGNPDEPLHFRHASPQGKEPPAGACREEEVARIEMLKNRREGTRMCRVCKCTR
ncbi:hypothetical protein ALC62_02196 [Cyphomyrmex costatus]|uniref:Uncharacterized protein n=1 Tax=Cyphomyrmex costatus TaxID=456900 RepID=A0A195D1N1_9HYME|nr:hypothetical protein ALC62_02196 [Cyphomyrmex costatus]